VSEAITEAALREIAEMERASRVPRTAEAELGELRAEIVALRAALLVQIEHWESLPSGADHDADPDDPSPQDATAHTAGLAIRAAREALGEAAP